MKYFPNHTTLNKHIDHYWIVNNAHSLFKDAPLIHAYPGITPEIIIVLEGHYSFYYLDELHQVNQSKLFSFIQKDVILDFSALASFVIIQFKPRALSSLRPFIPRSPHELMRHPVCDAEEVFGTSVTQLSNHLRHLAPTQIVDELNQWLLGYYQSEQEGFVAETANELDHGSSPKDIMALTKYSYSTLERYFKKDTGLTPKQYLSLRRYKLAVEEIYDSRNTDWMHYVQKYGYFDQSHFIKDIKRFTGFTPAQLLSIPGLRSFRPENL